MKEAFHLKYTHAFSHLGLNQNESKYLPLAHFPHCIFYISLIVLSHGQFAPRCYTYNDLIDFIKFIINKPLNVIFIYGFVF